MFSRRRSRASCSLNFLFRSTTCIFSAYSFPSSRALSASRLRESCSAIPFSTADKAPLALASSSWPCFLASFRRLISRCPLLSAVLYSRAVVCSGMSFSRALSPNFWNSCTALYILLRSCCHSSAEVSAAALAALRVGVGPAFSRPRPPGAACEVAALKRRGYTPLALPPVLAALLRLPSRFNVGKLASRACSESTARAPCFTLLSSGETSQLGVGGALRSSAGTANCCPMSVTAAISVAAMAATLISAATPRFIPHHGALARR
mmetsp:Transcript_79255/g.116144  ORF Transcript_79255/g.116144 Transcript_79255/m.116144 type:complete len:264 (-) Transcript_79255:23-814(-)